MSYVEVNDQRFWVEDTGGDGPPIMLSHGFLLDHRMFADQAAALRDVYRVVTWDARGFGATEFDGRPFTYWDAARDLFAILDTLGIERAVLGGMQQGGYLALRAALLHPDRVRALILIDSQATRESATRTAEYEALLGAWVERGYLDDLGDPLAHAMIGDPELESTWKRSWRELDPVNLQIAGEALLDREDIRPRLDELEMPFLLLHGTEDRDIPVARSREICAAVEDCRGVVEIEGAPHVSNLTHPDLVNREIRAFLEGLPA